LAQEEEADSAGGDLWRRAKHGEWRPYLAVPWDHAGLSWVLDAGHCWDVGVLACRVADHGLFFATRFPRLCNPHSFSAQQALSTMQAAASDREDRQS
jgi:hypothetical protein